MCYIPLSHALITFGFDTTVSPTGIEIDFFYCRDLGIDTPCIYVYFNKEYDFTIRTTSFKSDSINLPSSNNHSVKL